MFKFAIPLSSSLTLEVAFIMVLNSPHLNNEQRTSQQLHSQGRKSEQFIKKARLILLLIQHETACYPDKVTYFYNWYFQIHLIYFWVFLSWFSNSLSTAHSIELGIEYITMPYSNSRQPNGVNCMIGTYK